MKLLLDENLPIKLKYRFIDKGFETYTLRDTKWLGKKNGELLQLMIDNSFTTFITIDNNLFFQHNFDNYPLQVAVIIARDNTYETIMGFFDKIIDIIKQKYLGPQSIIEPGYK